MRGRGRSTSGRWRSARRCSAPSIRTPSQRYDLARLLLIRQRERSAGFAETALAAHDKVLGPNRPWTKDGARVTADALDGLGRAEEAAALRERYGVTA